MIKLNNVCGQSLSISNDQPLPFIQQRKQSLKTEQPQQYQYRYKYTYIREATEPQIFNELLIKRENPCVVQKEINNYKKKTTYTAPKNAHEHQKAYETVQQTYRQTQIKINRTVQKNRSLFASAHKVSAKVAETNNKSANRILISHNKRKAVISRLKDNKIKAITSQSQLKNYQPYFLNGQKMILVEAQRNKKSHSAIVTNALNNNSQQKNSAKSNKFYPNNSRLIKQINAIKQKYNIQRIIQMNQETMEEKAQNFHNFINIKSYQSKKQLSKHQDSQSKMQVRSKGYKIQTFEQKMNHILKIMQISQQTTKNMESHLSESKDKSIIKTAKQKTFKIQKDKKVVFNFCKDDVLTRKKNISGIKKYKKKLNIPFETYYYRDLLWKVNYTNSLYIEVPMQYEHRLKVFVGKGNNSCMASGLISRRYWYAFTDRIEQANFVWTQLKILQLFKKQADYTNQITKIPLEQKIYQPQLIFTTLDSENYQNYISAYMSSEQRSDQRLITRSKAFKYQKIIKCTQIKQLKMQNHLINNYVIGNKKALFNTMSNYYNQTNQQVFDFLPLTFHIKDGLEDKNYYQFLRYFHKKTKQVNKKNQENKHEKNYNAWIVKPGQNSNRGNGIKVCLSLQQVKSILKVRQSYNDGTYRTYIVQQYIQKPLLYFKRKFDLRHYMMITCVNGMIKGYWYKDGYVRTTSTEYSLNFNDCGIHLTNDAVQKQLPEYGKYEKGNKISYDQLNAYIDKYHHKKNISFYQHIYPKMRKIATDTIRACSGGIDPAKLQNNFEVFGLDFMIDADLNVWLIEVNSNPCLELSCPLLASIIPKMVENTLQLTLDAMFPPPARYSPNGVHYFKQLQKQNKYELVYDQRYQKLYNGSLQLLDNKLLEQEEDTFEDCGNDWEDS